MEARWLKLLLVCVTSNTLAAEAASEEHRNHFVSPSGNIFCSYFSAFDEDDEEVLRCDLKEALNPQPPRPDDCDLDWYPFFQMNDEGPAQQICAGDTVIQHDSGTLEYGHVWRRGPFQCSSSRSGIRCTNSSGHGWRLSRRRQLIF